MTVKIRLRKQGRKNHPFYRLVVTESTNKRDGKYHEMVGWYNPMDRDDSRTLEIKPDRIQHWLDNGAQMTESVEALVAKAAPEVAKAHKEKLLARQAKQTAKKRAARKK